MLWKLYRLRKNWQFQEVIKKGKKIANRNFVIFLRKNRLSNCQFGISIPQKLAKKATKRNHFKRQVRSILILYLKKHDNNCCTDNGYFHYNYVIIIRSFYLESNFKANQENLWKLLNYILKKKCIVLEQEK